MAKFDLKVPLSFPGFMEYVVLAAVFNWSRRCIYQHWPICNPSSLLILMRFLLDWVVPPLTSHRWTFLNSTGGRSSRETPRRAWPSKHGTTEASRRSSAWRTCNGASQLGAVRVGPEPRSTWKRPTLAQGNSQSPRWSWRSSGWRLGCLTTCTAASKLSRPYRWEEHWVLVSDFYWCLAGVI